MESIERHIELPCQFFNYNLEVVGSLLRLDHSSLPEFSPYLKADLVSSDSPYVIFRFSRPGMKSYFRPLLWPGNRHELTLK